MLGPGRDERRRFWIAQPTLSPPLLRLQTKLERPQVEGRVCPAGNRGDPTSTCHQLARGRGSLALVDNRLQRVG